MTALAIDWRAVQRRLGVTQDGIAGPVTWAAVFRHMGATDLADALGRAAVAQMPASGLMFSRLRLAHWLGQNAHESGGFRALVENLNYITPESLMRVWPSRFRSIDAARPFVRNSEGLANLVYGSRMGNSQAGDGWRYRGRGIKMITGRANYEMEGRALSLPLVEQPQLLQQPPHALASSLSFWTRNGCNALADADNIDALTRRINGGRIGIADRVARTARAKLLLA
jgi:putative chitinase